MYNRGGRLNNMCCIGMDKMNCKVDKINCKVSFWWFMGGNVIQYLVVQSVWSSGCGIKATAHSCTDASDLKKDSYFKRCFLTCHLRGSFPFAGQQITDKHLFYNIITILCLSFFTLNSHYPQKYMSKCQNPEDSNVLFSEIPIYAYSFA